MVHTIFDSDGNPALITTNANVIVGKNGGKSAYSDAVKKHTAYSDAVKKNVPVMNSNQFNTVEPDIRIDGDSAHVTLPMEFLLNSRKRWTTSSCIGHFVGGSFSFKFVKERVTKLWGNAGLKDVFFSSKGYYTFEFDSENEMKAVLGLNSVAIGGKSLYLGPWIDGSQFQKNFVPSITTWVKFIDVPHSLWSWGGLGSIAKGIGKPLALDAQTMKLKPMKYAGVLIDLRYRDKYPKDVWVSVINDNTGERVEERIGIEYSALPQSCSHCKAFGHPLARCSLKPTEVVKSVSDVLDGITRIVESPKKAEQSRDLPREQPEITFNVPVSIENEGLETSPENHSEAIPEPSITGNRKINLETIPEVPVSNQSMGGPNAGMVVVGLAADIPLEEGELSQPVAAKTKGNHSGASSSDTQHSTSTKVSNSKKNVDAEGFTQVQSKHVKRKLQPRVGNVAKPSLIR